MNWFIGPYTHFLMLTIAALVFHTLLWIRNGPFLWRNRHIILTVVAVAELWMFITDPIGGHWGAWYFKPDKGVGIWFFSVMPLEVLFGIAVVSSAAACATLVFGYGPRRWI
jgi:hypothetical protein